MTDEDFMEMEQAERQKHDDKLAELRYEQLKEIAENRKAFIDWVSDKHPAVIQEYLE